jgi:hypothetical protein
LWLSIDFGCCDPAGSLLIDANDPGKRRGSPDPLRMRLRAAMARIRITVVESDRMLFCLTAPDALDNNLSKR